MASRGPGCKHGGSCRFWGDYQKPTEKWFSTLILQRTYKSCSGHLDCFLHKYVTNNLMSINWWHSGARLSWDIAKGHGLNRSLWEKTLPYGRFNYVRSLAMNTLHLLFAWQQVGHKKHFIAAAAAVDTSVFQYQQLSTQPYTCSTSTETFKEPNWTKCQLVWGNVTLFMCHVKFWRCFCSSLLRFASPCSRSQALWASLTRCAKWALSLWLLFTTLCFLPQDSGLL